MVAVLPVLLYPMLGALGFQLVGFLQKHSTQVLIIGSEQLDSIEPPLFRGDQFANTLWPPGSPPPNFALSLSPSVGENNNQLRQAREALARGEWDVVVYFPPGFADQIADLQRPTSPPVGTPSSPRPAVFYNSAKEASEVGFHRFNSLLDVWQAQLVRGNLAARDVPESVTMPFQVETSDVASADGKQIRTWSRLLPFVVFVWALTGAFYPAVDLCAGEKERGTLESLLTSPALRSEIVSGKLLTVITFSIASALANLGSMVLTGKVVLDQMAAMAPGGDIGLEPPPFSAVVWLLVALLPMSALFSALSLAVAAFARSTKEGQYYLMPLLLGSMPLMMLPLAPNIELNFGTSIVPITGVVLLLRSAIEGNIAAALPFLPNVALVTAGCCILAIRWAVAQFNSETVLFRESENFTPWLWLRKLYTNRPAIHGGGAAVACIVAILFLQFMARGVRSLHLASPRVCPCGGQRLLCWWLHCCTRRSCIC
jgi:sodium transport system permease protein